MTPPTAWHPDEGTLQAYVDGISGDVIAASVEAHVIACPQCRSALATGVERTRLTAIHDGLDDRLDAVARPRLERWLMRLGLREDDTRALLAAPSLRLAWCLAVVACMGLALVLAANERNAEAFFLLVAPVLPVLATAAAYAPALDPAFTLLAATPYRAGRMLLARSVAVGTTALLGTTLAALALPTRDLTVVIWVLPSVALTLAVLALSRRWGTGYATAAIAGGWCLLVAALHRRGVDLTGLLETNGQVLSVGVAAVALLMLIRQWNTIEGTGA